MKLFPKKQDDFFSLLEENENISISTGETLPEPSHALTPEEVLSSKLSNTERYDSTGALDALKKRMQKATAKDNRSLLEKCKPYILDERGNDASTEMAPAYTLESVDDILKSDAEKVIDQLKQKYDITFDYLGKYIEQKSTGNVSKPNIEVEKEEKEEEEEKKESAKIQKTETAETFGDTIQISMPIKNVQSSVPFVISDIDNTVSLPEKTDNDISSTSTITFTPVSSDSSSRPKIVVTTNTRPIDLTGELESVGSTSDIPQDNRVLLENNDFDDFSPENEFKDVTQSKKLIRHFSILKRRSFLTSSFSVILTVLLCVMKLPFMSGLVLGKTVASMIVCTSITFLILLLNIDMFLSLAKTFSKKANSDVLASISSIFVLLYAVIGIINREIVLDILLIHSIVVSLRAISKFRKDSYMLSNLKQIAGDREKKAVRLISDPAVTFAMAKDSIEGDTLIAAPQKCRHIGDYIKYSTFGTFLNGKVPTIAILSVLISVIAGFTAFNYFDGAIYGFYAAAAVQCFTTLPILFFIDNLPLYKASKKLNKIGCMIAGKHGAESIETANALVLNSTDLFPIGTVTLHQMKVLSENNLDETILRAASLTETLNSPLAPIFKRIAGESNITSLPDSDTVKYEDRMGISGWVDNKLLFIGNRTLMETHGIAVPSLEVDHKILRSGYFPVYVASGDKVCALLMVQYDVSPTVANELRRLSKLGINLLVVNTDPNITNEMICDYLGLYSDSVMIMSTAGCHMYKSSATKEFSCSAPASFKGGAIALAKIMNCANRIRRSNTLLSVLYIISAILGIIIFAYASFSGSGSLIDSGTVLLYSLISTVISYILYLTQKP